MAFLDHLHRVVEGESLHEGDAERAMEAVLAGDVTAAQLAGFLVALKIKGETADELLGFARAMRAKSRRVVAQGPLLDTCGTGGDGSGTFNISTAAAFVVAGAGVRVAKHGNRSISSKCGSADIFEALGVRLNLGPEQMAACIDSAGIGFLFAPALHPAMKHAQQARMELKMRTVFNLLGPLTNPAGAAFQLIGAARLEFADLMSRALVGLRPERAFVVWGEGGLDEVTTTGRTTVFDVRAGEIRRFELHPGDFGVPVANIQELRGGGVEENRAIVLDVLSGGPGPPRDIVLVNAAVALVVAGAAGDWMEGMAKAAASIDSGAALEKVGALTQASSRWGDMTHQT